MYQGVTEGPTRAVLKDTGKRRLLSIGFSMAPDESNQWRPMGARDRLEALLLQGLESELIPLTDAEWRIDY